MPQASASLQPQVSCRTHPLPLASRRTHPLPLAISPDAHAAGIAPHALFVPDIFRTHTLLPSALIAADMHSPDAIAAGIAPDALTDNSAHASPCHSGCACAFTLSAPLSTLAPSWPLGRARAFIAFGLRRVTLIATWRGHFALVDRQAAPCPSHCHLARARRTHWPFVRAYTLIGRSAALTRSSPPNTRCRWPCSHTP